jgi:hypothetical protein
MFSGDTSKKASADRQPPCIPHSNDLLASGTAYDFSFLSQSHIQLDADVFVNSRLQILFILPCRYTNVHIDYFVLLYLYFTLNQEALT